MDVLLGAEIDAPGRSLDQGVVDGSAGSQISCRIAVHRQRRVTTHFTATMTLPRLPVIVGLRVAFVRQVGHCGQRVEVERVKDEKDEEGN